MDLTSMTTEALEVRLLDLLRSENPDGDLIRAIGAELRSRDPEPTPEQLAKAQELYDRIKEKQEDLLYRPSYHGELCPSNGKHQDIECRCDECDHYLECFPDWKSNLSF